MDTITKLNKLKKHFGTWHAVARELDVTYSYVCYMRNVNKMGKFLNEKVDAIIHLIDEPIEPM